MYYNTQELIEKGVGILLDEGIVVERSVEFEEGVILEPSVVIKGNSKIKKGARIESFSYIVDSIIGEWTIVASSRVVASIIKHNVQVGPYSYIRGNSTIDNNSSVGSYTEINNTYFGKNSKCKHFSYIGNCNVGEQVNIGAGSITCTYDGKNKLNSTIGDNVFLGSNTLMVAPVSIGNHSMTGAGSVVTKDVKEFELVYGVPAKVRKKV